MEDDPIATQLTNRSLLAGACTILLLSGCAHLYDPIDESLTCLHCEVEAAHTWQYMRRKYADVCYPHHFGAGFRAGYASVCRGGSGCPPTLPPKCYWSLWYRNETGRAKTVEWFNGFAAGAATAQQAGCEQCGRLVTSCEVAGLCDNQQPVEYDLSDLPTHAPTDASPGPAPLPPAYAPSGSMPAQPSATQPWPALPADEEMAPSAPPVGPSTIPPSQPAWGHSFPVPPDRVVPPQPTLRNVTPYSDEPSFVPTSPGQSDAASPSARDKAVGSSSARLPFGHSLRTPAPSVRTVSPDVSPEQPVAAQHDDPDEPIEVPLAGVPAYDDLPDPSTTLTDPSTKTTPPEPQPASTPASMPVVAPHDSAAAQQRSAKEPPRRNPDPWSRTPHSSRSPFITPRSIAPAPPTGDVPADASPPLEDRFLPRPEQRPVTSSMPDDAVFNQRPVRSLYDVLHRVQQTSHTDR